MADECAGRVARATCTLGIQREQHRESQRVGQLRDDASQRSDLNGGPGTSWQGRRIGDLVDDRQGAIHTVADQNAVVAGHDQRHDLPALGTSGIEVCGCDVEIDGADDRDYRQAERLVAKVIEVDQLAGRGTDTRRRGTDGPCDTDAAEVLRVIGRELAQARLDGMQIGQQDAVRLLA